MNDSTTTLPTILEIPRASREDLKALVLGYCDGRVTISATIPDSMLSMVFMPVALGALSVPEDVLIGHFGIRPGAEIPVRPVKPTAPEPEPEPVAPTAPPELEAFQERLRDLQQAVSWEEADEAALEALRNDPAILALAKAHDEALTGYQEALRAWKEQAHDENMAYLDALAVYSQAEDAYQTQVKALNEGLEPRQAEYDKLVDEFTAGWYVDLGVIYEFTSKAMPRSVNGYPTYFSLRLLHREDWELAKGAISRELKRREESDLFAEPPTEGA